MTTSVCGHCFREIDSLDAPGTPGSCSCRAPELIESGQAKMRLEKRWLTGATVPEIRWYIAHELWLDLHDVVVTRAFFDFEARVAGERLSPEARTRTAALARAVRASCATLTSFRLTIDDGATP